MTIKNYLKSLGIDENVILSEETKTDIYICNAFHLKRKSKQKDLLVYSSPFTEPTPAAN